MQQPIDYIEVCSETSAEYLVIWLHGLGADGHDFASMLPILGLPEGHKVHFIFPHAPIRAITINGGMKMRGWYDIQGAPLEYQLDQEGVAASCQSIHYLIGQGIKKGIPSHNIILAGFSQGGLIALQAGLSYTKPLAGLIALSTYLPGLHALDIKQAKDLPIFIGHGNSDTLVPFILGRSIYEGLLAKQFTHLSWHAYTMAHEVCQQEISDLSHWIKLLTQCKG